MVIFAVALSVALWNYAVNGPRPVRVSGTPVPADAFKINLNAADINRLRLLPGIGPVTAKAIIEHRTRHGPFSRRLT